MKQPEKKVRQKPTFPITPAEKIELLINALDLDAVIKELDREESER